MNDYKFVIDAGHGGADPGAVSGNLREKDLTLKAAQYMYDRFKQLGVPVKIIRNSDETLPSGERVKRVLDAYGNDPNVILISNHINAGGGEGAEVVYALRNDGTLAKKVLNGIGSKGQPIRSIYQRRLPSDPTKDYFFIMRDTGKVTPLLVEYGFIDNPKDSNRLQKNLLDYVEGAVKGIAEYTGINYKPPTGVSGNQHVVKAGESLWSIAQLYKTTVDAIKIANNLVSNVLNVGQILTIPITQKPPITGDYIVYNVQPNDTLYKIAKQYGVGIDEIIEYNQLGTTVISPGQQLLIPSKQPNNQETYIVKSGDSLWLIANRFGVSIDDLINENNLQSTTLQIGQSLKIPGTGTIPPKPPIGPSQNIEYIVQRGDSLWELANKYNTSIDEIIRLNNLTSNTLQIGQRLLIPSTNEYKTYYVRSGDSLWSIANKNNTTVDNLRKINKLTSDILQVGQLLLIP